MSPDWTATFTVGRSRVNCYAEGGRSCEYYLDSRLGWVIADDESEYDDDMRLALGLSESFRYGRLHEVAW